MAESQLTAKSVALRQLGYSVPEHDAGATVYGILPGTPGYRVLKVGDVITSVDGVATPIPPSCNPSPALISPARRSPCVSLHRPPDTGT